MDEVEKAFEKWWFDYGLDSDNTPKPGDKESARIAFHAGWMKSDDRRILTEAEWHTTIPLFRD